MFSSTKPKRPKVATTTDLTLAAYCMLMGASLQGVNQIEENPRFGSFVLTHADIHGLMNDYHACKTVKFSPKGFEQHRQYLKMMIRFGDDCRVKNPSDIKLRSDLERS